MFHLDEETQQEYAELTEKISRLHDSDEIRKRLNSEKILDCQSPIGDEVACQEGGFSPLVKVTRSSQRPAGEVHDCVRARGIWGWPRGSKGH